MNKDQTLGAIIFAVCAIVAIFYVVTLAYPSWLFKAAAVQSTASIQFWIIAIPVAVAFVAILAIGAWIGWTMATTPPPKPIEELTTEVEKADTKTA